MSTDGKRYLSTAEVAEMTGHPARVIRLWLRKGRVAVDAKHVGRSWYIAEADVPKIAEIPRRRRKG